MLEAECQKIGCDYKFAGWNYNKFYLLLQGERAGRGAKMANNT